LRRDGGRVGLMLTRGEVSMQDPTRFRGGRFAAGEDVTGRNRMGHFWPRRIARDVRTMLSGVVELSRYVGFGEEVRGLSLLRLVLKSPDRRRRAL